MGKTIKITALLIIILTVVGIWKYISFKEALSSISKVRLEQVYFQTKIDSFYYKNLNYPSTVDYKKIVKEYFNHRNEKLPTVFENVEFNEDLIAFNCMEQYADTNNISFVSYLTNTYCYGIHYEKEMKNIYSSLTGYKNGKLITNSKLEEDFRIIFKQIIQEYINELLICDSTKKIQVRIGSESYYTLLKGVKSDNGFYFSIDYSGFEGIEKEQFLIENVTNIFNNDSIFNYDVDLIYIPFNFLESKNLICE